MAMQIADPKGPWELVAYLPDNQVGHLIRAQEEAKQTELPVSFVLKSHTGETFEGKLVDVQEAAAVHDDHGHSYRVRMSLDKQELVKRLSLDAPMQGTEVVAKIACGRRSMAYCLFHELIEWVQIRLFSL